MVFLSQNVASSPYPFLIQPSLLSPSLQTYSPFAFISKPQPPCRPKPLRFVACLEKVHLKIPSQHSPGTKTKSFMFPRLPRWLEMLAQQTCVEISLNEENNFENPSSLSCHDEDTSSQCDHYNFTLNMDHSLPNPRPPQPRCLQTFCCISAKYRIPNIPQNLILTHIPRSNKNFKRQSWIPGWCWNPRRWKEWGWNWKTISPSVNLGGIPSSREFFCWNLACVPLFLGAYLSLSKKPSQYKVGYSEAGASWQYSTSLSPERFCCISEKYRIENILWNLIFWSRCEVSILQSMITWNP